MHLLNAAFNGHAQALLHAYGYWAVAGLVLIECAGIWAPGETVMLGAALAASRGHLAIAGVIAAAASGAIGGSLIGFLAGHWLGQAVLARHGWRIGLTESRLTIGRYLFALHGAKLVFLARFIIGLRSYGGLLAGANAMAPARFLAWTIAGGIAWPAIHCSVVYALGRTALHASAEAGIALAIISGCVLATLFVWARRREAHLAAQARAWESAGCPGARRETVLT